MDIANCFSANEADLYKTLEVLKKNLYDNKRLGFVYVNEDEYYSKLIEHFYDSTIPIGETINLETMEFIDYTEVFNLMSMDLCKLILEMFYTEELFMNRNYLDLTRDNIEEYCDVKGMYNTIIDCGLLEGNDTAYMLNERIGTENIINVILTTIRLVVNSTDNRNLIFMGWVNPTLVSFIKFNMDIKEQ